MLAGLDGGGLAQGDDRVAVARLELLVDRLMVVAHVQDGDLGAEPPLAYRLKQRDREGGLGILGRLHPPRQRQAGLDADNLMELVTIERTSRPAC